MRCVSMMRWENCHAFIGKEEERKMRFSTPIISLCVAATCIIMLVVQHRRKRDLTSSSSLLSFFLGYLCVSQKFQLMAWKSEVWRIDRYFSTHNWAKKKMKLLSLERQKKRRERKEGPNKSKERLCVDHPDQWYHHHHRVMSCLLLVIFSNLLYSPREVWRRRVSYD